MAKKLTDNLNSLYIEAANRLRAKKARHKIIAYVESYDDVAFWSHILSRYEDEQFYFQVMLPSNSTLAKGKKVAMMNGLGKSLGQNMIACVDADYDYLIQGVTSTSRQLIESPYVLHTYAYAIENYQCNPGSLHEVCVQATLNDQQLVDFPAFFTLYSNIIYPLFVWSIWSYRTNHLSLFSIQDFANATALGSFSINKPITSLEQVAGKVRRKIEWLEKHCPNLDDKLSALKDDLTRLGVTPDTTYLFIQGHHLKDNVALKMLIPICSRLRREREAEIKQYAVHNQQMQNELSSYRHSGETVETILKKNVFCENAPTYAMIERDIIALLDLCRKEDTAEPTSQPTNEPPQPSPEGEETLASA